MEDNRISIWLSPFGMAPRRFPHKEIAKRLGISTETFQQRLRTYGPDHELTYYPGLIPSKLRRLGLRAGNTGSKRSTLGAIKIDRLTEEDLHPRTCIQLITKLIARSKEDLQKHNCKMSRDFLLNSDGMLEYYLELVPGINTDKCLEDLEDWVRTM